MNQFVLAAFINGAGAVTLLAFLLFVFAIWDLYRNEIRDWRGYAGSLALSLLGAGVAFASVAVDFKVLSDETNLLSVANMLIQFGKASNTEMWVNYYNTFHALDVSVPTRPLLFPLLTALVHAANGMRWWSPFVVNFVSLTGVIFLALRWAKKELSPSIPRTALTLLALLMSPVLLINATSAGFDCCSLFFGFLAALLFVRYARDGGEESRRALIYTLVCFASVRYESIVALGFVGLFLIWRDRLRQPWHLYVAGGLLLLPIFVARYLTWGQFENPPGVPAFALSHLVNHLQPFFEAFFFDARGPYPILLHWLGLIGLFLAVPRLKPAGLVIVGYVFFLWALLLSHHFGFAGHPTQVRLFLPVSFALVLSALFFLAGIERYVDRRGILAVFVILFFHHHQYAVGDPLMGQLTMTREVRHIRDFIAEDGQKGDLFVYERPGQLSALGMSAISLKEFNGKQATYVENVRRGLYRRLVLIAKADVPLAGPYSFRRLRTHMLTPQEELRISSLEFAPWFPGREGLQGGAPSFVIPPPTAAEKAMILPKVPAEARAQTPTAPAEAARPRR